MRRFREMDSNSRQDRDRHKNIKPVQMIRKWLDVKFLHSLVTKDPTKWSGGSSALSSKEIKLNNRVTNDWVANSNHKISPCLRFLNLPISWLINHPTWAQTAIQKCMCTFDSLLLMMIKSRLFSLTEPWELTLLRHSGTPVIRMVKKLA